MSSVGAPLNLPLLLQTLSRSLTHKSLHVSARISTFRAAELVPPFAGSSGARRSLPFTDAFLCERGSQLRHTQTVPRHKTTGFEDTGRLVPSQRRFLRPLLAHLWSCSRRPSLKTASRVPRRGKDLHKSPGDQEQRTGTWSTTNLQKSKFPRTQVWFDGNYAWQDKPEINEQVTVVPTLTRSHFVVHFQHFIWNQSKEILHGYCNATAVFLQNNGVDDDL